MSENVGGELAIDRRLVDLVSDPLGFAVLGVLDNRLPGASVAELTNTLEATVETIVETLARLERDGMVECVADSVFGNVAGRRYRALVIPIWEDEEMAALSRDQRRGLASWIFKMVQTDFGEALDWGAFDRTSGSHMSRAISRVDERGRHDLGKIQREALDAVLAVQEESAERLAERGEDGVTAMTVMISCPLPDRPGKVR